MIKKIVIWVSSITFTIFLLVGVGVNLYMYFTVQSRPDTAEQSSQTSEVSSQATTVEASTVPPEYQNQTVADLIYEETVTTASSLGIVLEHDGEYIIATDVDVQYKARLRVDDSVVVIQSTSWENNLVRMLVQSTAKMYDLPDCFRTFNDITEVPYTNGELTVVKVGEAYRIEINPLFVKGDVTHGRDDSQG